MSEYRLPPDENIDISKILEDLEHYHPRRRGWTWREPAPDLHMGPFTYRDCSKPLVRGRAAAARTNFDDVDPQPMPVITTEIRSGRFEDDIRRMRMAAHTARITSWSSARRDRATLTA
jgi:D-ornithine 4,5-aminomutase subunit beta